MALSKNFLNYSLSDADRLGHCLVKCEPAFCLSRGFLSKWNGDGLGLCRGPCVSPLSGPARSRAVSLVGASTVFVVVFVFVLAIIRIGNIIKIR